MDENYKKKYTIIIADILRDKISKMKGYNAETVNHKVIDTIVIRAAENFITTLYYTYDEPDFNMIDEYSIEQIDSDDNWFIGESQCKTDYVGINLNIDRFFSEDFSDLSIQVISARIMNDESIGIVEDIDGTQCTISNENCHVKLSNNSEMTYAEGNKNLTYDKLPVHNLEEMICAFRNGTFSKNLKEASRISMHSLARKLVERDAALASIPEVAGISEKNNLKETGENTYEQQ